MQEMVCAIESLADELRSIQPGMTAALAMALARLRERNMWFLEENYRAFVLGRRRTRPAAIRQTLADIGPVWRHSAALMYGDEQTCRHPCALVANA
jgi:hypothetical protein